MYLLLRKIFGHNRQRVLGGCRNCIFKSVVICTQFKFFLRLLFKDVEMCGACSIHLRNEKSIQKQKSNIVKCIPKKNDYYIVETFLFVF